MSGPAAKTYNVIRQDNNGNHFLENQNLSEEMADAVLHRRTLEIGDHHQTIWKQDSKLPLPEPIHL